MRGLLITTVAASVLMACGDQGGPSEAPERSGISGLVHLGPQCPVETDDDPCADEPASGSTVTVVDHVPGESPGAGEVVGRTTTDARGSFRVAVAPGTYVVTADAGMSCDLVDVRVTAGAYVQVDIPCDTGIR